MSVTKDKDLSASEELRLLIAKHRSSRKVSEAEEALRSIASSLRSISGALATLVAKQGQ